MVVRNPVTHADDTSLDRVFTAQSHGNRRGEIHEIRQHVIPGDSVRPHFLDSFREDVERDVVLRFLSLVSFALRTQERCKKCGHASGPCVS